MHKASLQEMRRMEIFEEIEQPEYVYHMTSREIAKQILADGKVKVFGDYIPDIAKFVIKVTELMLSGDEDAGCL